MANQKEIRSRISSTISTQQITKAMKLVSATKLRKAQEAISRMRPYAEKLQLVLANLQDSMDEPALEKYFKATDEEKILVVLLNSDRGLCGAFNANMVKQTKQLFETTYASQYEKGNITILPIGKKAPELLSKYSFPKIATFQSTFQNLSADAAFEIGDFILNQFNASNFNKVVIVYNKFKNAATQFPTVETLLPVETEASNHKKENNDYIFEPSKVSILQELIPRSIKTQLYKTMLDSQASEHGARMVAMDKSTENAGELLKALKLSYNQARQAAITNEISEIVGGVAALQG